MISRIFPPLRDLALLLGGLALLWHETVAVPDPRPLLLAVAIGMLGLPASLLVDRRFVRSLRTLDQSPVAPIEPGPPASGDQPCPR
jgi:hypothetical protein